jgi:hypothetical protein
VESVRDYFSWLARETLADGKGSAHGSYTFLFAVAQGTQPGGRIDEMRLPIGQPEKNIENVNKD